MLRTRAVWTGVAGTPWYTTYYWNGDGPALASEAQDQTIAWLTAVMGVVSNTISATVESEVLGINEATGNIFAAYDVAGSTSTGTSAGEPLPYRTQALTNFGTGDFRFGRRVRGRTFLGGLSEGTNVSGVGPVEATREAIQATYNEVLRAGDAQLVVWSRPREATATEPARVGDVSLITSMQTSTRWSSLRSRGV